ncbi:SGNH/GDSL hydrolase family protein [Sulfobacillus harzensis]|uniref:SGNH/GDSL hydrolase family protein n=1 Tax=Sulfobacillus harzensis TaxID=2729629 RepID=A0A7Y0L379_9FIRM|nr:SGNH/GDSL hydrolase family protein [Sulfobacillus harzensis]NMP22463.1 SGNH/GDSL hydrolase family protein [Sulfobacillus harzensis]
MRRSVGRAWAASLGVVAASAAVAIPWNVQVPPVPTVIIGGSAAKGWHDRTGESYIDRALAQYAGQAHVGFKLENRAIPGAPVTDGAIKAQFPRWMTTTRGGVVVIAWGLLNDIRLKTPRKAILQQVHREIRLALDTHHRVLVVSPPATLATLTFDRASQAGLWSQIIREATDFHNPNVYVANVMAPMERYIAAHHQSPKLYMDGKWDPNTRGHILAGQFLLKQLDRLWKGGIPAYYPPSTRSAR